MLERKKILFVWACALGAVLVVYDMEKIQRAKESMMTLSKTAQPVRNNEVKNTEYQRRLQRIHDACAVQSLIIHKEPKSDTASYYFSPQYNVSYCKVQKAGCSFWTQVFAVLRNGTSVSDSVFGMPRILVHQNLSPQFKVEFNGDEMLQSRSILESRDPYTRLFSAFVDKMFLPNMFEASVDIVRRQRNLSSGMYTCSNDITFQEFLDDILLHFNAGRSMNGHWAPIVSMCKPCSVKLIALVKQETFTRDVDYVLKELGVTNEEYKVIVHALHDQRLETSISSVVDTVFKTRKYSEKCLTKIDLARRLWTSFQIQGYLKEDIPVHSDIITAEEHRMNSIILKDLILKTIRKHPMTSEESKLQRRRALIRAFANISDTTIEGLKRVYKQDFSLFDYSMEPPNKQKF